MNNRALYSHNDVEPIVWDSTGFPMLWVPTLRAHLHFWPLTKVQFEIFVCNKPNSQFSENTYNTLLDLNPRISPGEINERNYWHAFVTGLLPYEAESIAQWYGDEFEVPSLDEWHIAYTEFARRAVLTNTFVESSPYTGNRVKLLLNRLLKASDQAVRQTTSNPQLVDQMLMRWGVIEWVKYEREPSWAGMGRPNQRFFAMLSDPGRQVPSSLPKDPLGTRLPQYGVRLLRRIQ